MNFFSRLKKICLLFLLLCFLLGSAAFLYYGWQKSSTIIHPPASPMTEEMLRISRAPADYGLVLQPFSVPVEGGSFRACLISAAPESEVGLAVKQRRMKELLAARKQLPPVLPGGRRGTIILAHDWGRSMESMYPVAEYLTAAGFHCLAYDLRAHGQRSPEENCTYGRDEKADMAALIQEAEKKFGDLGSLGAYGDGLGAAVSLQTAAEMPALRSVVSLNSFSTLKDAIWHRLVEDHGKVPAYLHYLTGDQILQWRMGFRCFDVAPVASAAKLSIPVLVATNNREAPFFSETAQKIYTALASREKKLYTPFDVGGTEGYPADSDEFYALVTEWFAKHTHPPVPEVFIPVRRVPPPRPQ